MRADRQNKKPELFYTKCTVYDIHVRKYILYIMYLRNIEGTIVQVK